MVFRPRVTRRRVFDTRGTGMSDRLPSGQEVRLDERMDDIRAVMDAAGCERAVLLAQSDGVPAAAAFPERVSGLIVYGTSARMLPDEGYVPALPAELWERALDALEVRWGAGWTTWSGVRCGANTRGPAHRLELHLRRPRLAPTQRRTRSLAALRSHLTGSA